MKSDELTNEQKKLNEMISKIGCLCDVRIINQSQKLDRIIIKYMKGNPSNCDIATMRCS